jgi:hypothetical protein
MKTRKEFPQLLNSLNLIGEGAEIGVYKADYSKVILDAWKGRKLFLIDPWQYQGRSMDKSDVEQTEQNQIHKEAREKMKPFKGRVSFIREKSHYASFAFGRDELDFVYLDACHDYRSVWQDLEDWWPKVKEGGIVAGHDYKNSCVRKNLVEVKRAVDDYFYMIGGKVLTTTEDNLPSWYVTK